MIAMGMLADRTVELLERHRRERVAQLTEQVVDALVPLDADYGKGVSREDLAWSVRDNVDRVLEMIADPSLLVDHSDRTPHFDAARATGRRRAEQGMPLDIVLRSFRVGARMVWEDLNEYAGAVDVPLGDLREIGTRLWVAVDESSAQVAAEYHDVERGLLRAHEQHRASLWEGLLGGRAENPAFAIEAAAVLGIPSDGPHLVVALDPSSIRNTTELEARFGAMRISATFVRRTADVVGVLSAPEHRLAEAAGVLREHGPGAGGISAPVGTLRDLGTGYRQASLALGSLAGREEVVVFDECLADALLLCAPEIADRLVEVWCAPLLALPGWESSTLLDTLTAWAEADGSSPQAADQLYCHRNTVVNRMRRISEVLGRELSRPVPTELTLALRAVRLRR